VNRAFKDYLDKFLKVFLDDFMVYSDMDIYLQKFKLHFQKCKEFGISLNPYKCVFYGIFKMILGFIVSKEGKLPNPKKIQTIIQVLIPTNP
jgi:hypothetical protein